MTSQRRIQVPWLMLWQFLPLLLLAPGDGGRWLKYTILFVGGFDIAAFLLLYLVDRLRQESRLGLSMPVSLMLAVGSYSVAWAGTYVMAYFKLP